MTNPNLKDLTHDSHHSAQETVLGTAIMNGTITPKQYLSWLYLQSTIHNIIDPYFPAYCHRYGEINLDILELLSSSTLTLEERAEAQRTIANDIESIEDFLCYNYCIDIDVETIFSAGYIMLGAHLMGGPKNKKHLESVGLPVNHLEFKDGQRQEAREVLFKLRNLPHLSTKANYFFSLVRDAMDNIK